MVAYRGTAFGHGVAAAMGDPPLAVLAPVHLGGTQGVGAWLAVNRLVAGPQCPPGEGVAVVQGELRVVERGPDPREEVVVIGHALRMLPGSVTARCPSWSSGNRP